MGCQDLVYRTMTDSSAVIQESPSRKIPAHHQTDGWCANCSSKSTALELDLQKAREDLEASKNSQGILKVGM